MKAKKKGKILPEGVAYINHIPEILSRKCPTSPAGISDLRIIMEAYDVIAANCVVAAAKIYQEKLEQGEKEAEALESCCKSFYNYYNADYYHCVYY